MTQSEKSAALAHLSPQQEFNHYWFDGALLDELNDLFPSEIMNEVRLSLKDRDCTKQFLNKGPMLEACGEFTKPDKKVRLLDKTEGRAARVLVSKYLLPDAEKMSPIDFAHYWEDLIANKKGAAGVPAQGSKEKNIEYLIDLANRMVIMIRGNAPFSDITIPAKCFHRAQLSALTKEWGRFNFGGTKLKDRMVMGVDGATILIETSYGKGIYNVLKTSCNSYAGGKTPEKLRSLINRYHDARNWLSLDYSKFDMHMPAEVIRMAFDILYDKYIITDHEEEWQWIVYNFINTQFQTPDNEFTFKTHGIPSGSYFTQPIGTVCNMIMLMTGMCHLARTQLQPSSVGHNRYCPKMIDWVLRVCEPLFPQYDNEVSAICMGDDSIIFTTFYWDEATRQCMCQFITNTFGVEVNPDKCDFGGLTDDPYFLKRFWNVQGEYQDPVYMLVNIIHAERVRHYDNYEPIHIIYGLYCTFEKGFKDYGISEEQLLLIMASSKHGIAVLRELHSQDVNGIFRSMTPEERGEYYYSRASRKLEAMGIAA